jgi:glycosyltransferase involved in cell wall biosynthesis
MKILWAKTDLLHPTTRGGQIRTLETLRRMRDRHEIHYVAFSNEPKGEGVRRSFEYCQRCYTIPLFIPPRNSLAFALQLTAGLFSPLPLAILRYRSRAMRRKLDRLIATENYDSIVCDFLSPATNFTRLQDCILFQHNVETTIWQRHSVHGRNPIERSYLASQAHKMSRFEREVCRRVKHVIAVSEDDAASMKQMSGRSNISTIPTGVDVERFTPPSGPQTFVADLVFLGSMDWLPNIDGVRWFVDAVLPLIRRSRPECRVAIVGRNPGREIEAFGRRDPLVQVTGTVPDVRPWLWGALVSIVPLRIGGGTRIKIYESMAAQTAVVSTTIGAEGLNVHPPSDIRIGDRPETFAAACLELLDNPKVRNSQANEGRRLVVESLRWDGVASRLEKILDFVGGNLI